MKDGMFAQFFLGQAKFPLPDINYFALTLDFNTCLVLACLGRKYFMNFDVDFFGLRAYISNTATTYEKITAKYVNDLSKIFILSKVLCSK